ncbi:MAG: TetR/AcrR family transcriptional regulator [Mycobacterium sp.]
MAGVVYLRSYDDRNRDDEEIRKVLTATVELLRETPYSDLTMQAISKHAGVSVVLLREHFWSKDAIVAEIYLDRLRAAPLDVDVELGAQERIAAQFSHLVMLLADEPGLAAARSSALVCAARPCDPSGSASTPSITGGYARCCARARGPR